MLVTSTALSEKQEDTKTICNYLATKIHFFGTNSKDNLKSNKRLIDTVPKYLREDFFKLSFLDEERSSLKKLNTVYKNLFHTFGYCQFEDCCSQRLCVILQKLQARYRTIMPTLYFIRKYSNSYF